MKKMLLYFLTICLLFGCVPMNQTQLASDTQLTLDQKVTLAGAMILTKDALTIAGQTEPIVEFGEALNKITIYARANPYTDLVVISPTEVEARQLVLAMQQNSTFMKVADSMRWQGSIKVVVRDPSTMAPSNIYIVRPAGSTVEVLSLDTIETMVPNSSFVMRQSAQNIRVQWYVLKTTQPAEIEGLLLQQSLQKMPPLSMMQAPEGVLFEKVGVRFGYYHLSNGWGRIDPNIQGLQNILYELSQRGIEVPTPYLPRLRVLPDRSLLLDVSGAKYVSAIDSDAVNQQIINEWEAFMREAGPDVQHAQQVLYKEEPYIQVQGPLKDIRSAKIEPVMRNFRLYETIQIDEVLASNSIPPKVVSVTREYITSGETLSVIINVIGAIILVNEAGRVLFRFGPNVKAPSAIVPLDDAISQKVSVSLILGESGVVTVPAPWLTMVSDESRPELLPTISDLWDEANEQMSMGEFPGGFVYLENIEQTNPEPKTPIAIAWYAEGTKDNPVRITLEVNQNAFVSYVFQNGSWIFEKGNPSSLEILLDTSEFEGVACVEPVTVDEQQRIHFSRNCTPVQ